MRSLVLLCALSLILAASCVMMVVSAEETYDTSFLETKNGVKAWSCCRICPQNHLINIDQWFGSTPPPVRRYDDPQPAASTFLEMAERIRMKDNNCCNICPTGQAADHADTSAPVAAGSKGVRRNGLFAPLANLKFTLSRVPLPPCCPFCREEHMDEAYNSVIKPEATRDLPYIQRKDAYSGRKVFLETEVDVDLDMEVEAESEKKRGAPAEYGYESASPDYCCNRCIRAPTPSEEQVAAGGNLWPQNEKKPVDYDAQSDKEQQPGAIQKRVADSDQQEGEDENDEQ